MKNLAKITKTRTKTNRECEVDNIFAIQGKAFAIDRLKICYSCPSDFWDKLDKNNEFVTDEEMYFDLHSDDFGVDIITNTDAVTLTKKDDAIDGIRFLAIVHDKQFNSIEIGELYISNSNKYKFMAFFQFTNFALYHVFGFDENNNPYNGLHYLPMIEKYFNLQFKSITKLEIAVDTNINVISRIRKYIRDIDNYDMVINGKKVRYDSDILPLYGEYYERSRTALSTNPTLYFHQKDDSYSLRVYDKSREIDKSKKTYISNSKHLYRCELTIRNEDIKEFCKSLVGNVELSKYSDYTRILEFLNDEEFQFLLFYRYSKRMIYFIDKKTKVRHYLTDILNISDKFREILKIYQK